MSRERGVKLCTKFTDSRIQIGETMLFSDMVFGPIALLPFVLAQP